MENQFLAAFAGRDINTPNLKAVKGQMLPHRFQTRMYARALKKELGEDSIIEVHTGNSHRYRMVDMETLEYLESEVAALRQEAEVKGGESRKNRQTRGETTNA